MNYRDVFRRLEQVIGLTGTPRKLHEAIEFELQGHFGLPPIQAAEKAEEMEESIRQLIIRSRIENESKGVSSVLSLSSINQRIVLGSCYVENNDGPEVAKAKRGRLHIDPLLTQIRNLTFDQFEIFGACVLKELGAKWVKVTPHSDDQGIDFYGYLSLGQHTDLPLPFGKLAYDVTLGFAGQAKHYPKTPIGPELIRELAGSISLARYKVFTREPDLFEDLQLMPYNPVVAMFFTTGRFTNGARELAESAGIIARSGEQLAVFLADRGVGIENIGDSAQFSSQKFFDWLKA